MANINVVVQDANNVQLNLTPAPATTLIAEGGNNVILELTPTPTQVISLDRGVAGVGIESITVVTIDGDQYLHIVFTNGSSSDVGPISATSYTGVTPIVVNNTTNQISLDTVPVASGGTGATTASGARTNLGLGSIATQNSSSVTITGGSISGITDLAISDGGTGASTAADARTNLGLGTAATTDASAYATAAQGATADTALQPSDVGTIASQNSNSVTITGGSITGITDLAIADGGTGASTAANARTNLGLGSAAVLTAGAANGVATLDSGGTVPLSQIPASIQGGVSYQGAWNASTNSPTLTSSVGSKGYYYVVSAAGSTNLNGVTDWNIGDWAIFNGTVWQKIDNTDAVTSVNGLTGTVVLTASSVGALASVTSADGSITVSQIGTAVDLAVSAASPASTLLLQVRNNSGATMTKGTVVYINGAIGQLPTIAKALATSDATSAQTQGLVTADISNNSNGYVTIVGLVTNIDTSAYTDGAQLYLSGTTAGAMTTTKQYAPIHLVYVGVVVHAHATQGKIQVKVQNGYELDEIHNVSAQTPSNGQTIVYNSSTQLWEQSNAPVISGTTIDNTVIGGTTPAAGTFTDVAIPTATGESTLLENTTITGWIYSENSFSISAQESLPNGLFFSPDGLKMYVNGSSGDDVNEYTLGTAWNITTATFVTSFSTVSQDSAPADLFFKPDGLTMFVLGGTNDTVYQYTLGTAWSVATASYASKSFSVTTQDSTPTGIWFKPDGTAMYMVGSSSDTVYQYTLGTAWDISTASYASKSYSVASQETTPTQVNISADGTKMWVLGSTGDKIWEYTLGTAWDVSTATPVNNFYVGFQDGTPTGLFIDSSAANRVFIVGSTTDAVYQYNTAANSLEIDTEKLYVDGQVSVNGNFVANSNAYVDGALTVQGATTFSSISVLALSVSAASVSSTLTATSTLSLTGSTSGTASFATSQTTANTSICTSQTSGTFTLGGTSGTGTITLGRATTSQTTDIQAGATASGNTKTINMGTAGVSGSTTNINIGSAVSGALGTTIIQSPTLIATGQTSFGGAVGSESLRVVTTASAVNWLQAQGGTTGNGPVLSALGSDTNIDLTLTPKGTGVVKIGTNSVAINGPAFSAYATSGVSTPNATATKVSFDTEEFDTNSNFASSRFTPTVAGYYQVNAGITGGFSTQILNIYKNGTEYKRGAQSVGSTMTESTATALVYCNGSTDYVEVYWYQASGSTQTSGVGQSLTYFQGFLARAA